jgi:hypothetical protein
VEAKLISGAFTGTGRQSLSSLSRGDDLQCSPADAAPAIVNNKTDNPIFLNIDTDLDAELTPDDRKVISSNRHSSQNSAIRVG